MSLSLFDLSGKKALVTGSAGGIGRACALALAEGGADVAVVDLNKARADKTVAAIKALGREAFFVRCDVANKEDVEAMVAAVVERFGCLDIAINNAGMIGAKAPELELEQDNWERVIGVNLTGVWLCAQAQAKQMVKQTPAGGKIINTASIAAVTACADGAYSAAKAGVVQMTRSLAAQWGQYNINVNSFSPGSTRTPLMASMTLEMQQQFRELTPLGHHLRPQDFAGVIVFMASAASDAMTGQNLVIDGGITLNHLQTFQPPRAIPPRLSPEEEASGLLEELGEL